MRLSIIIIEYHCMHQVTDCIDSINQHLPELEKECLIISNSEYSQDELASFKNDFSDTASSEITNCATAIIDAQGNLGYAGGVNTGIKHAKGEYIYVLNPDCLLTDSNVTLMMDEMAKERKWAISGPKVVDENTEVQPSCRRFPRPWTFLLVRSVLSKLPGAAKEKSRYLMEDFDRNSTKEVSWVSGGATLVKSSLISKMGGMDERYFLYMEDVDWCRNCWNHGLKVKYIPVSVVIHAGQHQSISGSLISKLQSKHVRLHLISMFKYFNKHKFTKTLM